MISLKDIVSFAANFKPTKKAIVGLVGRFCDPLSFLFPVVTPFKIFLQDLFKTQVSWDDLIMDDILAKWQHLSQSLTSCQPTLRIHPCYARVIQGQASSRTIYGFCDVSFKVYAAVLYM